jgi:hypothetical protein
VRLDAHSPDAGGNRAEQGAPAERVETPQLYYIQNRGYCGNCMSFWRMYGKGYTCDLDDAWKVPKEKAEEIVRSRPTVDTAWPVEQIDAAAQRHVSIEVLREQSRKGGVR